MLSHGPSSRIKPARTASVDLSSNALDTNLEFEIVIIVIDCLDVCDCSVNDVLLNFQVWENRQDAAQFRIAAAVLLEMEQLPVEFDQRFRPVATK